MSKQSKHSIDRLKRLQKVLEEQVAKQPAVQGVGIGLNADRSNYALKVMVTSEAARASVPDNIDGVDVICELSSDARAF